MPRLEISTELRRAGVAASTIRDALGDFVAREPERIIAALALSEGSYAELLKIKADATAFHQLKRQLDMAMQRGEVDTK
jgi:hypothetical protein